MIILFIFLIGILILIHEFGHFLFAKILKVRVEEFGIGFPPRIFKKRKGETIFSFNLIPLGGFVKLYGEEEKKGVSYSFSDKSPVERMLIIVAGVILNIFLAYFIFSLVSFLGISKPIFDERPGQIMIFEVSKNSPAYFAGLRQGDFILNFNQITDFQRFVKENLGKDIELLIKRKNQVFKIVVAPRKEYPKNEGPLGVAIYKVEYIKKNFGENFVYAGKITISFLGEMIAKLFQIFKNLLVKKEVPKDVVGPVGIFHLLFQLQSFGLNYILFVFGIISLNLALINILPFPALDGGRFLFVFIEFLTGKQVNKKVEEVIHAAGFIILIFLALIVTIKDLRMIF